MELNLTSIGKHLDSSRSSSLCLYADFANLKISGASIKGVETISELELANLNYYLDGNKLSLN